jgi:hypothetical protein
MVKTILFWNEIRRPLISKIIQARTAVAQIRTNMEMTNTTTFEEQQTGVVESSDEVTEEDDFGSGLTRM